jgi:glycosyltransferase involved in cell wall biosynthesis
MMHLRGRHLASRNLIMPRGPHITFLNLYHRHGGAERCLGDLAHGVRERGYGVDIVVGKSVDAAAERRDGVQVLRSKWWEWLLQRGVHRLFGLTDTLLLSPFWHALRHPAFERADVIHIHVLHGSYFNLWALPLLAWRKPVVVTLHDMWLLTGDCVYSDGCERWQTACGSCPVVARPRRERGAIGGRDLTRLNLAIKRQAFAQIPPRRLRIVSPSRWLDAMVGQSHLAWAPRRVVPYGIDLEQFAPTEMAGARRALGLPAEKLLLAAVAASWDNPYKGGDLLLEIAAAVHERKLARVVAAGRMAPATRQRFLERGAIVKDGLHGPDVVRQIFSACDGALVLSRQENLPFVVIEALACGCPPIATSTGGIPEMFASGRHGRHGWLLPSPASVSDALGAIDALRALSVEARADLRRTARARAEERFARDIMLDAYAALYADLLRSSQPLAA